jgi:hypothetical protein
VAIGNAIFVRDRNWLTKNEQSTPSFAIQTGPDGTRLEWLASYRVNSDDLLFRFFPRRPA